MSARSCAAQRSMRRAPSTKKARSATPSSRRSRIERIIRKQEEVGLKLATDGEYRRAFWHFDFFGMLDGVEVYELDHGIQFQGIQTKAQSIRVNGKIGFSNHPMVEH